LSPCFQFVGRQWFKKFLSDGYPPLKGPKLAPPFGDKWNQLRDGLATSSDNDRVPRFRPCE
jgi:hypothetical protein